MNDSDGILFEETMRSLLGEKAEHIANQTTSAKYRRHWYRVALTKVRREIGEIETTTCHKEQLASACESALHNLEGQGFNERALCDLLLSLISALIGFTGVKPYKIVTPTYFQTPDQHYTSAVIEGEDPLKSHQDRKSSLALRRELALKLKEDGHSTFMISLILNISDYQVKKLLHQNRPSGGSR